ncbi:MAG TPA: c-type cytochrome [Acidobacteriaceae bacterium]|jgi:cytochrome c|nr:c-type cytochrome [Acidobacteriaceae bacterium]
MKRLGVALHVRVFQVFVFLTPALISFAGLSQPATNPIGDAQRGKALFEKRCTGCHSLDQDREGPRLHGVYGRKAGSVPGFEYSQPLKSANLTWDEASLNKWLTDPDTVAPGNEMAFRVPRAQERADIIRFLKVSSGQ